MKSSHARCPWCGRLLAPIDNKLPAHRVPPKVTNVGKFGGQQAPLTGLDAPWCRGGGVNAKAGGAK